MPAQTLRHLNVIVDKVTPVISVFGFNEYFSSLGETKRRCKRLFALVPPERFIQDGRAATRAMMTLSRAMNIVKSECQYAKCDQMRRFVLYSVELTEEEYKLRMKEYDADRYNEQYSSSSPLRTSSPSHTPLRLAKKKNTANANNMSEQNNCVLNVWPKKKKRR